MNEPRQRSRIEDVEIPAAGLTDAEVETAAKTAELLAQGIVSGLTDNVRLFYADLAAQLRSLAGWRAEMLNRMEDVLLDPPDPGEPSRGWQFP